MKATIHVYAPPALRSPPGRRSWSWLAAVAVALVLSVGCGEDDDTGFEPITTPAGGRRGPGAQAPRAGGGGPALKFHEKIDDRIGEEEAGRVRHVFTRQDFGLNLAGGTGRRDPFRPMNTTTPADGSGELSRRAPERTCKKFVADNYSLRDLRLVGIVLRGTVSYALFVDSSSKGHTARKNDCIGLEKAQVISVRSGFVSLRISPDNTASADPTMPQAVQERTIALYPEELQAEGDVQ
ncbi:pilus assembly protein PilP [Haliangium sp.]|uniref:pilus assembly protein PilP n=1 Tax=Haliangium sp. TaxID=2663208 RepID=UPI003D0BE6BF